MGVTYRYANLTRREWLAADALGGNAKGSGLGYSYAARAFDLLLIGGGAPVPPDGTVHIGRWSGDPVTLVGDSDDDWLRYETEFADIEADLILMMHRIDGFDRLGDAAERDEGLFMQVCYLVATRQAPQLEPDLARRFGPKFWHRYKETCREWQWFRPRDVAFPALVS